MDVMTTVFRVVGAVSIRLYRLSGGRIAGTASGGIPVLLLTVAGRKSGKPHTMPVGYVEEDGGWLVVGSAGGQPTEPQWFKNLRAAARSGGRPRVELGRDDVTVTVEVPEGAEQEALRARVVAAYPFFLDYEKKAHRPMPVAKLTRA